MTLRTTLARFLILFAVPCLATAEEALKPRGVVKTRYGEMPNDAIVDLFTFRNSTGLEASVMTLGATLTTVKVPDRDGKLDVITLHRDSFAGYAAGHPLLGSIVGRFANRVAGAKFVIDGKTFELEANAGKNHIHGGSRKNAFHWRVWSAEKIERETAVGVKLSLRSPDGQAGFPGQLDVSVEYLLTESNQLVMEYSATTTKATHLNLTNHAYWNLAGASSGGFDEHVLQIVAGHYLPSRKDRVPTGEIRSVEGSPFDFRKPRPIGARLDLVERAHYDHCYVLKKNDDDVLRLVARVHEPKSGRQMDVYTTQPGVQLYTGNKKGFCLETQHFPNSPNEPKFPSTLLRPGETFREKTVHQFGIYGKKGK